MLSKNMLSREELSSPETHSMRDLAEKCERYSLILNTRRESLLTAVSNNFSPLAD